MNDSTPAPLKPVPTILEAALLLSQQPKNHPDPETNAQLEAAWTELERQRQEARKKALSSFWYFVSEVAGLTNLWEPFHKPVCDQAEKMQKGLYLLPRTTMKSTILSDCYPVWILLKFPDTRILLSSEKLDNPKKWVKEQLELIDRPSMKFLFPEFTATETTKSGWVASTKTARTGENSITIASIDHSAVSKHFELMIYDDLLTDKNSTTAIGLESVEDYYNHTQPLLDSSKLPTAAPTHTMVIGTQWSFISLYTKLEKVPGISTVKRGAYNADGSLACPTKLTKEFLEDQKAAMPPGMFSAQYMNEPLSEADSPFKHKDLRWFAKGDFGCAIDKEFNYEHVTHMAVSITYDPAKSLLDSADDSCIMVCGADGAGNKYVLEYVSDRIPESQVYYHLFRLWDKWKPQSIFIEKNGVGDAIMRGFAEEQRITARYCNVVGITSVKNKELRILRQLEPVVRGNRLFLMPEHEKLIDQLVKYPRLPHDDAIDALAMQMDNTVWGATKSGVMRRPDAPLTVKDFKFNDRSRERKRAEIREVNELRSMLRGMKN